MQRPHRLIAASLTLSLLPGLTGTLVSAGQVRPERFATDNQPRVFARGKEAEKSALPATYTIRLGDTLWGISRRFNLPLTELVATNRDQIPDPDLIRVGQSLRLVVEPASQPQPVEPISRQQSVEPTSRRQPVESTPRQRPVAVTTPAPRPLPAKQVQPVGTRQPYLQSISPTQRQSAAQTIARKPPAPARSTRPEPVEVVDSNRVAIASSLSDLSSQTLARRRRSVLGSLPAQKLEGNRLGAAKRGSCAAPGQKLVALLPETNLGQTVSDQPTFFWLMPELKPEWQNRPLQSRFQINAVESGGTDIDPPLYEAEFESGPPGIASLTVQKPIPAGQNLRWTLKIICDPEDSDGNEYVKGWIRRVEPSAALSAELEKAKLVDYPSIYAKAGLWFDALRYLSAMRRKVGDEALGDDWEALLKQVQLGEFAGKPLACRQSPGTDSCTAVRK